MFEPGRGREDRSHPVASMCSTRGMYTQCQEFTALLPVNLNQMKLVITAATCIEEIRGTVFRI